jgi:hypothetical protein
MRERMFLGLSLVGTAMFFLASVIRRSGSMSPPCPTCGRIDDLSKVDSTGFHMGNAILWECSCGNTRAVLINDDIPRVLIEEALARDEMQERTNRERTTDINPEAEE